MDGKKHIDLEEGTKTDRGTGRQRKYLVVQSVKKNNMFRALNRTVILPVCGFTLGVGSCMKVWPEGQIKLNDETLAPHLRSTKQEQNAEVLKKLSDLKDYKGLLDDVNFNKQFVQSEKIPVSHQINHVGQGLLFGEGKFEMDPIIFHNEKDKEIVGFYHLGSKLSNEKNKIHKGVLSLILDEALCYCGFPSLPNKRGVTAKLSIEFERDIPIDSTIMLQAKVTKVKGRKCVINGHIKLVNLEKSCVGDESVANAKCILVEPRWFKYLNWVDLFEV